MKPAPTATAFTAPSLFFIALCLAHVALKLWYGSDLLGHKINGDEHAYSDAAKAISNLIRDLARFSAPDVAELKRHVVGNGWFMPGMSVLLVPLYLVLPDPDISTLRIYLGLASLALWLWTVLAVRKHLGIRYAFALLVFPSLVPLWVIFSFTAWGDLYAGLLLVILLCHSATALRSLRQESSLSLSSGIKLGALAAVCLYLRSSVLPLIPLLLLLLLAGVFLFCRARQRGKALLAVVAAASIFLAILLPWSLAASATLKARVLTTTTVPVSMGITFGNPKELCFGPCARGNIWFSAVRYSKAIAAELGTDEVSVQKNMARYATREVTPEAYAAKVLGNFGRYAFRPASFTPFFAASRPATEGSRDDGAYQSFIVNATRYPYYLFMLFLVLAWLTIIKRPVEQQLNSILIKVFSACMFFQPFVHVAGGRYWTVFAPLFALSLGLLLSMDAAPWNRRIEGTGRIANAAAVQTRLLTWAQLAFVVGLVSLAIALAWLGRSFWN